MSPICNLYACESVKRGQKKPETEKPVGRKGGVKKKATKTVASKKTRAKKPKRKGVASKKPAMSSVVSRKGSSVKQKERDADVIEIDDSSFDTSYICDGRASASKQPANNHDALMESSEGDDDEWIDNDSENEFDGTLE